MRNALNEGLPRLGLELPDVVRETLCAFGRAVIEQNKVMNLTAITQPDKVAQLQLLDSSSFALGFPGGSVGKESTCQCRYCAWVGKILWRRKW